MNQPSSHISRNIPLGIFHSLIACLYWSIVFIIPSALHMFDELDIVFMRYVTFGLFSIVIIIRKRALKPFAHITKENWKESFIWAFLTIVYYFGIALSVRFIGPAMTIIISGLAPVIILFYANIKKKVIPYSLLAIISLVIFSGVLLTNLSKFQSSHDVSLSKYIFGLSLVTFSTGIWVWYVLHNQAFLKKNRHMSPDTWGLMLGVSSLVLCVPLIACGDLLGITHVTHNVFLHTPLSEKLFFTLCCSMMGIFSSSLAIASWNKASYHLSPALLGALLIFEPIFGLILSYVYEKTLPPLPEILGAILMLTGSLFCVILFKKKTPPEEPPQESFIQTETEN